MEQVSQRHSAFTQVKRAARPSAVDIPPVFPRSDPTQSSSHAVLANPLRAHSLGHI